jgi:hypothetical protein
MKNPIVKRKVAGLIIKGAAKKQAAKLAKQRHKNWLKNEKPTVRGFNRTKPWVINQAGKATNKIPSGATSRKAMGHGVPDKAYGPVISKPSAALKTSDKAWKKTADRLERELKKKPKAVRKTPPPSQLPAPRAGAAVTAKPSARLPAVSPSARAAAGRPPIPPLSLKGVGRGKKLIAGAAVATGAAGEAYLRRKQQQAAGKPVAPAQPAPAKKPGLAPAKKSAPGIKDPEAIKAVERMLKDRGRDAVKWHPARVAREDPQRGDAKEAEKVAKSMKGKDPDWMDKFLGSMGIKKTKGPKKEWEAGKRTYQIGGKGGKTFDIDSTPYEETLTDQEREQLEASYKKGGKIGKKKKKVGKKKQGYNARKGESIAMRVKKKRTKKQLKASRDESYGKWGSKKGKGKITRAKTGGSLLIASFYD